MNLTEAQTLALFDAHWSGQTAVCPKCGGAAESKHSAVLGGYLLTFRCPNSCDIPDQHSSSDPKWPFRDWTSQEQSKLVADFAAQRTPRCPACAIPVNGQAKWVFSGQLVQVRCPRCRKECEDTLPR
jgi:tRNA(Ile2) C34 agmatinyltransferase TiaS